MAGGGVVVFVVVPSLGVVSLFNIIGSSPAWFVSKKITRKHGRRHRGRKMKWTIYQI